MEPNPYIIAGIAATITVLGTLLLSVLTRGNLRADTALKISTAYEKLSNEMDKKFDQSNEDILRLRNELKTVTIEREIFRDENVSLKRRIRCMEEFIATLSDRFGIEIPTCDEEGEL